MRFTPAFFPTSSGLVVPSPSYLYSFVSNPNFGAIPLTGGNFDQPYGLAWEANVRSRGKLAASPRRIFATGFARTARASRLTQQFVDGDRALSRARRRAITPCRTLGKPRRVPAHRRQSLADPFGFDDFRTTAGLVSFYPRDRARSVNVFARATQLAQRAAIAAWASDPYPDRAQRFRVPRCARTTASIAISTGLVPA